MGTEQDVERAEQLYQRGEAQGNATAKLLANKLKNKNGRGCTQMDLGIEQEYNKHRKQRSGNQRLWCTGNHCGDEGAKALASMLLMNVPLKTLDLCRETATFVGNDFEKSKKW